ncbi:MAG: OmpA family protein [Lutisporaceae bacterium]
MAKYKLTKRGKLVVVLLCSFIVLFVVLGVALIKDKPSRDDTIGSNIEQNQPNSNPQPEYQTPTQQPEPNVELLATLKVAVYFDPDASSVNNKYYTDLDTFIVSALQYKDINIQVEGNCATLFDYYKNEAHKSANYNLSLLRAQAIANYLKTKGVNSDRLVVIANGSDKPFKDNGTAEGRKINRRVDIFFVDK